MRGHMNVRADKVERAAYLASRVRTVLVIYDNLRNWTMTESAWVMRNLNVSQHAALKLCKAYRNEQKAINSL